MAKHVDVIENRALPGVMAKPSCVQFLIRLPQTSWLCTPCWSIGCGWQDRPRKECSMSPCTLAARRGTRILRAWWV
eukprot:6199452-Pleurochrysis_carterae.AAC.1